jgi:hypothetical protein
MKYYIYYESFVENETTPYYILWGASTDKKKAYSKAKRAYHNHYDIHPENGELISIECSESFYKETSESHVFFPHEVINNCAFTRKELVKMLEVKAIYGSANDFLEEDYSIFNKLSVKNQMSIVFKMLVDIKRELAQNKNG